MFKNKKYSLIAIAALLIILALGLVAFTPTESLSAALPDGDGYSHGRAPGGFKPGGSDHTEALAETLGISVEELEAAYESVQAAALADAVADGKLTQEQAGQIAERGLAGGRGAPRMMAADASVLLAEALGISENELQAAHQSVQAAALEQALADGKITEEQAGLMAAHQSLESYFDKEEMLAKTLGITVDELEAAREDGQRLPDLLEELGIDRDDFGASMQALKEDMLAQAVADGVITQEQADQMLENDFRGQGSRDGRGKFPGHPRKDGAGRNETQLPEQPVNQN